MREYLLESVSSDESISDVLMTILATFKSGLAVVQVNRPHLVESEGALNIIDNVFEVILKVISTRPHVLRVEPESYVLFALKLAVDHAKLFYFIANDAAGPCGYLEDESRVIGGLLHDVVEPGNNAVVSDSIVLLILHASNVEDNTAATDSSVEVEVVKERDFCVLKFNVIRCRHVDEVDGVKEDLLEAGSLASQDEGLLSALSERSGVPSLRRGGVDLDGVDA